MLRKNRLYIIIAIALAALFFILREQPAPTDSITGFDRNKTELVLTKHARCRMDCRHIDESEIREILQKGTINYSKSEPNGKPDPKYALEGTTHDGQQVRIVFAPSGQKMVVITVIDLGKEWTCNCK